MYILWFGEYRELTVEEIKLKIREPIIEYHDFLRQPLTLATLTMHHSLC